MNMLSVSRQEKAKSLSASNATARDELDIAPGWRGLGRNSRPLLLSIQAVHVPVMARQDGTWPNEHSMFGHTVSRMQSNSIQKAGYPVCFQLLQDALQQQRVCCVAEPINRIDRYLAVRGAPPRYESRNCQARIMEQIMRVLVFSINGLLVSILEYSRGNA